MTSPEQFKANKANAQNSTGPKTAQGKAKSSSNAKKHGLTAPPPWEDVTRHFCIIMADATAVPNPKSTNPRHQAALRLAETEAHLERCYRAERHIVVRLIERAGNGAFVAPDQLIAKGGKPLGLDELEFIAKRKLPKEERKIVNLLIRNDPDRPAELQRRAKRIRRYRRAAERRARVAFDHWLEIEPAAAGPGQCTGSETV